MIYVVGKDPMNHMNHTTENYRKCFVQMKCEDVQNHGNQWLTFFITDFIKLHITDHGRI